MRFMKEKYTEIWYHHCRRTGGQIKTMIDIQIYLSPASCYFYLFSTDDRKWQGNVFLKFRHSISILLFVKVSRTPTSVWV